MIQSKFKSRLLMSIFIVLLLSVFSCGAYCAVENAASEKAQPVHLVNAPSTESQPQASSVDDEDVTPETWRHICFEMSKDDGSVVRVELLRPLWWIERSGAKVDGVISLTIAELGIAGNAKVLEIGPCTADSRKVVPGSRIVTGKFIHENARVLDLYFSSSSGEPLGVTPSHPLWSITRNDWVEAGELKIGESVKTKDGIVQLIRRTERSGRHTVYNLEVHKDHTYYVSSHDILVHNGCARANSKVWSKLKPYKGKVRTSGKGRKKRFYEWDHTHGDIEVYDHNYKHLGSMDAQTGKMYKPPVKGRKIKE